MRPLKEKATPTSSGPLTGEVQSSSESKLAVRAEPPRIAVGKPVPHPEYKPSEVRMSGFTAPDGIPWVYAELLGRAEHRDEGGDEPFAQGVWTRLEDWSDDAAPAKRSLKGANIHLFGDAMKSAVQEARDLNDFPARPLIERPGWTASHFALPSGEVFSPPESAASVVLFPKNDHRCEVRRVKGWRKRLANLAGRQPIIEFALMLPFAAPLLRLSPVLFNPGFELVGPKRRGKSTLQQLAASLVGPAVAQHGRNYVIPANTTVNALEELTADHADLPLIIEEMGLYYAGENEASRARKMLELIMRLASGTVKARRGESTHPPARFVYLTSSNETLASMLQGRQTQTSSAAGDRLLTIPIAASREHGIFDRLPKGCASGRDAIRMIVDLIKDHHGHPMRIFLKHLVAERAADEDGLKERIQALINNFREAVGVDDNVGSESSIADVFGLIYAAGVLAQEYGALPRKLKLRRAVVRVYSLSRALSSPPPTHLERLHGLAKRKGVIHVDVANLADISDDELARATAVVRTDRMGSVLLLLTDVALNRAFVFPKRLLKDPDVGAIMRTDSDKRKKLTVSVRRNKKQERLYAFALEAPAKLKSRRRSAAEA